jgi:hypothetical protein
MVMLVHHRAQLYCRVHDRKWLPTDSFSEALLHFVILVRVNSLLFPYLLKAVDFILVTPSRKYLTSSALSVTEVRFVYLFIC